MALNIDTIRYQYLIIVDTMSEQQQKQVRPKKAGRPKTGKPQRVMVSVPGPLVEAVKEIVRVYREQERQP